MPNRCATLKRPPTDLQSLFRTEVRMTQLAIDLDDRPNWRVTTIRTTSAAGVAKAFSYLLKDWPDGAGTEVVAGIVGLLNLRASQVIASVGGEGAPAAERTLVAQMQNLWNDTKRSDPRVRWLRNVFEEFEGQGTDKIKLDEVLLLVNRRSGATVTFARGDRRAARLLLNGQPMQESEIRRFLRDSFNIDPGHAGQTSILTTPAARPRAKSKRTAAGVKLRGAPWDCEGDGSPTGPGRITGQRYPMSQGRLTCCDWSTDGTAIYASGFDGLLHTLSADAGGPALRISASPIRAIRTDVDTGFLLAGDDAGRVTAIELKTGEVSLAAQCATPVYSIAPSDRARTMVLADRSGSVEEWAIAIDERDSNPKVGSSHRLRVLYTHAGAAFSVRYHAAGRLYVSVGADGSVCSIRLDGGQIQKRKVAGFALFGLAISSPDGLAAVGDQSGRIHLCEQERVLAGHDDMVRTLEFSPKGTWLFSGSKDRTVRMWHCSSGQAWILSQVADYIYEVTLSPNGRILAVVDGAGVLSCINFPRAVDELTQAELSALVEQWDGLQSQ